MWYVYMDGQGAFVKIMVLKSQKIIKIINYDENIIYGCDFVWNIFYKYTVNHDNYYCVLQIILLHD